MPNLIDLDISEVNITALPARAFYESTNVENLILPNTLTTIGASMFSESALKSVIIPNGVTTIERNAFEACKALTSIEIPASVETIGPWAFRDCSSLKTVTFGKDSRLKKIGTSEYGGSFMRCTALTSIEIPASVETIEATAFYACTSLKIVTFEKGSQLKTIGGGYSKPNTYYGAFGATKSLATFDMSECTKVAEIGDYAFAGEAFSSKYESLQLLKIGTKVPPKLLGENVFYNGLSAYFVLKVPVGCVDAYKSAWRFSNISELDE